MGSVYEGKKVDNYHFNLFQKKCCFTDDTVITIAIAEALLCLKSNKKMNSYEIYKKKMRKWGQQYPDAGYGNGFYKWLFMPIPAPYYSYGNGSAMRISAIAHAFKDLKKVLHEAKVSAEVTHNHPEGIKGAQAIAMAIYLAKQKKSKVEIKKKMCKQFNYVFLNDIQHYRDKIKNDLTCQITVPIAISAFLESKDYESTIRNAVYIGGDSDTLACMAGGIAEAFYGIPENMKKKAFTFIPGDMKKVIKNFYQKFNL